jgi:exoribonuclease II
VKRIIAWAVVNDHGKIPTLWREKHLLIFKTKAAAEIMVGTKDSVIKVTIERQSLDI